MDTIFALATPQGRSGVAVIRVSGPASFQSLSTLSGLDASFIMPREAVLKALKGPVSRETIDHALILPFKAPASFTGEDVVEYHLHGSQAIIQEMLAALAGQSNHRMAEPGEFTRRAFENGKMDLTEAEAIADLIDAETSLQKAQALDQLEGSLSKIYQDWTERLKKALAHIEADIEFPDEDLPDEISPAMIAVIKKIQQEIASHLDDNRRGERLRDGVRIAVIGAPNAGKSTLVNALAQRDVAIVSDMAGTTRDIIEVHLDLGGYPVILSDTAGLRPEQLDEKTSGHNAIEGEGIRRALEAAQKADLKILVFDGTQGQPDSNTLALKDERAFCVINKSDGASTMELEGAVKISAKNETHLDQLLEGLAAKIQDQLGASDGPSLTRARHREALQRAEECLSRALLASLPELLAEDLRLSVREIGRITGRVDVEDLLDVIFKDFCIGK